MFQQMNSSISSMMPCCPCQIYHSAKVRNRLMTLLILNSALHLIPLMDWNTCDGDQW
jgi:hypothetical protein